MDKTIEVKTRVKDRKSIDPLEQHYHESGRIWKLLKEKSKHKEKNI